MKKLRANVRKAIALMFVIASMVLGMNVKAEAASASVWYGAHVANIGWQTSVKDGATAGTTGRALQMEALMVDLSGVSGGVTYRAHVANIGWMGWVTNKQVAGTTGRALQMEAVEIKLTGNAAAYYDIQYRVHIGNVGWQSWESNGATAGTTGENKRIEAIQIRLVAKSSSTSVGTSTSGSIASFMSDIRWREGTSWDANHDSYLDSGMGKGCNAYCRDFTKFVYGKSLHSGSKFTNISDIHAGDCIYVCNSDGSKPHWMVVVGRSGNTLDLIHGNWTNGTVCRTSTTISGNKIFGRSFQFGYHY